jgi:hypothetical protein
MAWLTHFGLIFFIGILLFGPAYRGQLQHHYQIGVAITPKPPIASQSLISIQTGKEAYALQHFVSTFKILAV